MWLCVVSAPSLVGVLSDEKTASHGSECIYMRTCKVCGRIFRTKKTQLVNDPLTCTHPTLDRRGSSRRTSRPKCTLCGTVGDELFQEERRERALVADSVKNATSTGFDLHRRLAFEDNTPLSVEVIVSAIEEFKGVVEEAVSAGDEVTAHDLHTMLQDALEANSEGTEHWSVASSTRHRAEYERQSRTIKCCVQCAIACPHCFHGHCSAF